MRSEPVIGGVFTLYGIVLVVLGMFGAHPTKVKASGININLWAGLGMLALAALMVTWALTRPVEPEPSLRAGPS